jgi:Relaxase/Mobilisation nuclease domain
MPKTLLKLRDRALLDLVSRGRGGPKRGIHLSADQIAVIDRTVRRVPEVMVKVLPKDSNNLRSVSRHLNYIGRYGKLELQTDDGACIQGEDAGQRLLEDWDLDLDKHRTEMGLASVSGRSPKLVHKVMLSMPPGTPSKSVLEAVRNFTREEFALKHRYALILHTDEPHPHVHLVVKAVSEQGVRLHTTPATLRVWRREFARHLRDQGIAANATERAVRGETRTHKADGIYRASLRGESTHMLERAQSAALELAGGKLEHNPGHKRLASSRRKVEHLWSAIRESLTLQGHQGLASEVRQFVAKMPPALTEKEHVAQRLLRLTRNRDRSDQPPAR